MKITFNSPFILGFTILASFILTLSYSIGGHLSILTLNGNFDYQNWQFYMGLLLYPLSHSGISHLVSNFSVILLIGPILEKQMGWQKLLMISSVTTIVIGITHVIISDNGLIGASGLVFLYIVLVSLSDANNKEIPLTFILVVMLFLGQEILASFKEDQISHLAHIGGGVMAILYKYVFKSV
ncbi:MAG: rhomboid family intramembrane serine protease [Crocinitomicaceae bacterium]|nr:rhomboid family intramembrane serine protease [Crocinitomicaceae bacterium]